MLDLELESFPVLLCISFSVGVPLRSCNLQAMGSFYQDFDQSLIIDHVKDSLMFLLPPHEPFTKKQFAVLEIN